MKMCSQTWKLLVSASKDTERLKTDWVSPHGVPGHFGTARDALRALLVEKSSALVQFTCEALTTSWIYYFLVLY